jgi:hypothetical protein
VKRQAIFFVSLILSLTVNAQWNDAITDAPVQKNFTAGVYGNADYSSNCITTAFAINVLQGNYLASSLKNQVSSQLQKFNRLDAELNYGIYGVWYNDTSRQKRVFNFFFALRHKSYINSTFSPDVFNLAFYGNAMYAGKSAVLMPFSLNMLSYQQAEIGMVCTNFNGKAELGIGLSFLAAHQLLTINENKAMLYTDSSGQYLQFSSDAQSYRSDTSGNAAYINGYGASMDIYFKAPYKIGKRTGTISISATDLGFIYWNNKSLFYNKDTSYYYDGVTINSLSDLQTVSLNGTSKDSLQSKFLPFVKKSFFYTLPSTLSVNSNTDFGKYHLELGYNYIFNANDIGYIYAQGDKYLANGWITALQVGYGGYSTLNMAIVIKKKTNNSTVQLVLNHLPGLLVPSYFGGAGLYIEYSHTFGK